MDNKDKKLVIVLLAVSASMLISGYFFVPFVVHIWTYIANLAGEKDMFLATTLFVYFVMFAFLGAALGIALNAYGAKWIKWSCGLFKRMTGRTIDVTKKNEKN
jgi:hypothetical protein